MINYVFVYLVFAKERYLLTISLTKTAKPFKILRWDGTKMFRPRVSQVPRHHCKFLFKFQSLNQSTNPYTCYLVMN